MKIEIAPSILSADKKKLQEEVKEIEPYADLLHVDVMDGKFVPPTTFEPEEIKAIKTTLSKDVHLMVSNPLTEGYIDSYIGAGAAIITIHEECDDSIEECIQYLRDNRIKVGLSIKPKTQVKEILNFISQIDMVLVMSVEPGYGGQKFMPEVLPKIKELRDIRDDLIIEVDGGINKDTIRKVAEAGANIFVAGSAIFGQKDRKKAIQELREKCK
jgi:ribulose-phosphate 3-epimerase